MRRDAGLNNIWRDMFQSDVDFRIRKKGRCKLCAACPGDCAKCHVATIKVPHYAECSKCWHSAGYEPTSKYEDVETMLEESPLF